MCKWGKYEPNIHPPLTILSHLSSNHTSTYHWKYVVTSRDLRPREYFPILSHQLVLRRVQITFYVEDAQWSDDRDCICIIQENCQDCQKRLATLRLVNKSFYRSASHRLFYKVYSAFDSSNIGNKPLEKLCQVLAADMPRMYALSLLASRLHGCGVSKARYTFETLRNYCPTVSLDSLAWLDSIYMDLTAWHGMTNRNPLSHKT